MALFNSRAGAILSLSWLALWACPGALAQPFQLIVNLTPAGSIQPNQWQSVPRYAFSGSFQPPASLSTIPNGEVSDPISAAFRTPTDLFVANRAGNGFAPGSISRFRLSNAGQDFTFVESLTQNGLIGPHQIAFNPVNKELFAAAVNDGIWRWTFNSLGSATDNGAFARGRAFRGVIVEPTGTYLLASAANSFVYRFVLHANGNVTELPAQAISGASNLHFMALGTVVGEIYCADVSSNAVFRLRVNADGSLTQLQTIPSTNAISVAFSPDRKEMFVGRHITGGIDRFTFNVGTDSWTFNSTISTPSLGGIAAYVPAACPCDLSGDGLVDNTDFVVFANAYLFFDCNDSAMPLGCPADFSLDGLVDNDDFLIFVAAYNDLICS